jgi:2-methylcitrate dehydratase
MDFDHTTAALTSFADSVGWADIDERIVDAAVRHHLDSAGCAIGGMLTDSARIVSAIAKTAVTSSSGASVFGIDELVAPEQAVFANSTMLRQLDFNDFFAGGKRGGHLSDMIPAVIAAAELCNASGMDAVRGIYIAYEVFAALSAAYPLRDAGWDHSANLAAVGAAAGSSVVLGSTANQIANAISLAITPTMALASTRTGEVSSWKGSAAAFGAMAGILAARLARHGMTGPKAPFEGREGLNEQVAPESEIEIGTAPSAVERSNFKQFPAVGATQSVIGPLIAVREQVDLRSIARITVDTNESAWKITGGGAGDATEKWNPRTRETADHSMPYVVARTLIDGTIKASSFSVEKVSDPVALALMNKISVRARADLTARYPAERLAEITIELSDASIIVVHSANPVGSTANPMTDRQLSEKFQGLCEKILNHDASLALEQTLWRLTELSAIDELTYQYRSITAPH